jgi:hypothetical protein
MFEGLVRNELLVVFLHLSSMNCRNIHNSGCIKLPHIFNTLALDLMCTKMHGYYILHFATGYIVWGSLNSIYTQFGILD